MQYVSRFILIGWVILFALNVSAKSKSKTKIKVHGRSDKTNIDFDASQWMNNYYKKPEPERLVAALKQFHNTEVFSRANARAPLIAFLSQILRKNPDITKTIAKECSFLDPKNELPVLAMALWYADTDEAKAQLMILAEKDKSFKAYLKKSPVPVLETEVRVPSQLDMNWACFFATGNTQYLDKIIECLVYRDTQKDPMKLVLYGAARWSLDSNCRMHKKVLDHCEYKSLESATPEIVKEQLKKITVSSQRRKAAMEKTQRILKQYEKSTQKERVPVDQNQ